MRVRPGIVVLALLACFALEGPATASASTIYFANDPGQWVTFVGDGAGGSPTTFSYGSGTVTGGDLMGWDLSISGVYSIGDSINSFTRAVNGGGVLTITDGAGNMLTADIVMTDIFAWGPIQGTNSGLSANLSNIAVSPTTTNNALLQFASSVGGSAVTTFNIIPLYSVDQLAVLNGTLQSSFSGSAVPEPATLLLLGTGLAGAGIRRMRRRRAD